LGLLAAAAQVLRLRCLFARGLAGCQAQAVTRAKADPAPLVIFVGDIHTGSTTAVAPKAECRTAESERLLIQWEHMVTRAKAAAKGAAFVLALGGDLIDGPRHHDNWQTWGTHRDQRNAAIALLQPLANLACDVVAVKGTEVHAGGDGQDDQTVAEALGARRVEYVRHMVIGGKKVLWSHHGLTVARDRWNMSNAMYRMAVRLAESPNPPDLAVFHHVHMTPPVVTVGGVTVATVGCWQESNAHGFKIRPERGTDIGVLAWQPALGKLEHWPYNRPAVIQPYEEIKLKAR
jgi:hypothetical protein